MGEQLFVPALILGGIALLVLLVHGLFEARRAYRESQDRPSEHYRDENW